MSSRTTKNNLNRKKIKKEIIDQNYWRIKIQCPNCGSIFIFNDLGECYCIKCRKIYPESVVRERCGL